MRFRITKRKPIPASMRPTVDGSGAGLGVAGATNWSAPPSINVMPVILLYERAVASRVVKSWISNVARPGISVPTDPVQS
jgi:hypothetical protein